MKIAVIGTGYVGLVAGTCFADSGHTVICVDKDADKIMALKRGEVPIYEPGLETLLKKSIAEGRLAFTTATPEAVEKSEVIFFAVGTPPLPSGEADLSFLKAAVQEVARSMTGYRLLVNKSTVPIGTHKIMAGWLQEVSRHAFDIASNPEFLKEGSAVEDFLKPDRVVIGTDKEEVYQKLSELYAPFVRQGNPILQMSPISAELTKYACNSFLATRISFMNEISNLCDRIGADVESVRKGMVTDVRIGKHFLYAGAGYGGSCFPKDIRALLSTARRLEVPMGIIEATEEANERQKYKLFELVKEYFQGNLKDKIIAVWGLAFKPNTDDVREAPAGIIVKELLKAGAKVQVYDPVAMKNFKKEMGEFVPVYCKSPEEACINASALLLVTEWNEFRNPNFSRLAEIMKEKTVFDGRNILAPSQMKKHGFTYFGIGRRA